MDVSRSDLRNLDEIILLLNKVRFDVNGPECLRLASSLQWVGHHRQRVEAEIQATEEFESDVTTKALTAYRASTQTAAPAAPAVDARQRTKK